MIFEHGYALLIGVNENRVSQWALPQVIKDVQALQGILIDPQRCAYPPEQVKTITGPDATRGSILDGLDWLHDQIQGDPEATAIVYYSGHGWHDHKQKYFLIPYDVRELRIQSSALRAEDLTESIDALQSRKLLVILDCCHAGGMGVKGLSSAQPTLPEGYAGAAFEVTQVLPESGAKAISGAKGLETLTQGDGRAVLSSSTSEQESFVRRDKAMSIFTYHLIEALTGYARPNGADEVLVSDVMGHVTRRVPASAQQAYGAAQVPTFRVTGNFPIALLMGGKGLSGQPAPDPLQAAYTAGRTVHAETYIEGGVHIQDGDFVVGDKIVGAEPRSRRRRDRSS